MTTPESSELLDSVNKLLGCAKAIEDGVLNLADSLINHVLEGNDDKRVKYFVEALVRRVYRIYPKNPRPLVLSCTDLRFSIDYQFFPFVMFAGLTARSAIEDALTGKKRIQVIDFSLMASGERWGCLLDDYVKQSGDAISFHLTIIGPILFKKGDYLNEILEKLTAKAKKLPIEFEVKHVVANSPAEIVEAALKLERSREDETIIVRWEFELHKLLAQPGATESVLSKLKELKPEIMIVVEQEASLNGQDFLENLINSIHYYSIVFDSLDNDDFDDCNYCKVLWEMYFRRQISNLVAHQSTDQIVRLQTFAEWREILSQSGFHHVRLRTRGPFCGQLPAYNIEEKNRHPVLYRDGNPLLFTSAWKPDPTQPNSESSGSWNQESSLRAEATIPGGSSGPPILAGTVSSSFLDVWPPECFSINQIAASAEIFDMIEDICHVHYLPLARTWMSDRRVLHLEKSACYVNDFTMVEFVEACGENHLEEGKGVAGKALQLNRTYLVSDITDLKQNNDVKGFPSISDSREFGLHGVVAIKLASVRISSINYVLEFFLPPEMREISAQRLLVNEIVSILQKNSRNSWRVCNEELSRANICSEVEIMAEEVGTTTITPAAIPASQPSELSEIGGLTLSQIREPCNILLLKMAPPLIDKLMECAKAIEDGELKHADSLFREIGLQSSTEANLATRKVVKYFAEALVRRLYQLYPRNPMPLVSFREDTDIVGCKFEPFLWFASHTIMPPFYDALRGKKQVHIIDFSVTVDIGQHATLMKMLADELGSRLSYRITLVGPKLSRHLGYLNLVSLILSSVAKKIHIDFKYEEHLANSVAEIVGATLQLGRRSKEEAVVVEWVFELHKLLAVPSEVFNLVMSKLKDLKPEVMVIVEQEADHNSPDLMDRLTKSFKYYSVMFDSLEEDIFDMGENYRVLWERIFRRQITKVVAAEGVGHAERHETWAQWRVRLLRAGFHPARILFRETMLPIEETNPYRMEEKNRCPLLCRLHYPFAISSAWKPDVTQDESLSMEICDLGSMLGSFNIAQDAIRESGKASSSLSHEDDADDDIIMMKGNIWSTECFSINQVAASAEIFDILEYVCHVHDLPMALTWVSDRRADDKNSREKFRLHIVDTACFVNDVGMKGFFEACVEGPPLEEGQGVAGKALQSKMQFVPDVADLDAIDYPFLHVAWEFGLHAVLAIKLASTYMRSVDYILEFVFPLEMREISAQSLLANEIVSILQKNSRNSWIVCNEELSRANICSEVEIMAEEVGTTTITPAAIPASQPSELSEIGGLTSSQIREPCNIFKPPGDKVRVPETHDQEVEQQNSIFRPAADHFNTSEVEIMAEEVGTNTITQAAIPGSQPPGFSENVSITSSQIRELCNICTSPGDEVRVPETHDQEVEQQNSIFRPAADHFNTSEVEIMAEEVGTNTIPQAAIPASQPPELSGCISSVSWLNPPGDEVRVPETHDQEVEQQNSIFRPAADHFNTSEVEIMAEVGTNTITQAAIPASQPPELSEIGCLSSFSWLNVNPPGDEVRVPETHDQEVEQRNSTFRPAADHSTTGTRRKRRRTSEVWLYFDEVIENGKVWAKCRNCTTKYRGESTKGTTTLWKHARSCTGKK